MIKENGDGVLLFNDTSQIFVAQDGNALDVRLEVPWLMFDRLEFMGLLIYDRMIGRDQYFYKLKDVK